MNDATATHRGLRGSTAATPAALVQAFRILADEVGAMAPTLATPDRRLDTNDVWIEACDRVAANWSVPPALVVVAMGLAALPPGMAPRFVAWMLSDPTRDLAVLGRAYAARLRSAN